MRATCGRIYRSAQSDRREGNEEPTMLTIYRRHKTNCEHRAEGRRYRRCRCPIWVDGMLNGKEIRESLELQNWEKAQERIREWEAEGRPIAAPEQEPVTVEKACRDFLADAESRELQDSTLRKHRQLTNQMIAFAKHEGLLYIKQWEDIEVLRRFRQSWADKGLTVVKKLERLRALLRFAVDSKWIEQNPAMRLKNPLVKSAPTMPFTQRDIVSILAACDQYQGNRKRMRALVLLLRYSGLRIGDAVRLARDRIAGNRLFLYTQKTGVPVWVPLPDFVTEALNAFAPMNNTYYFWSGASSRDGVARTYMARLRRIFELAGIPGGHAHRFRDTFAVELLLSGVPLERVSVLLGHSGTKVTEKHYSPWVKARQEQLEADVMRTWARDPLALAQTKGTPEVHGIQEAVN
jgi:integrase/recombinase XerD